MFNKDNIIKLDPSPHSPHNIIPKLIRNNSVILDVGCNTGFLGKILKEKNVVSDGIDINQKALLIAKKYYRNLYKRDLYTHKININEGKYNYIIFSDILEHLPRPDLLLLDCKKYLKKNGKIIVSLPNVARLEIRLALLFGKFNYHPGILSTDHLRFFTKKSALELLKKTGFEIVNIKPTGLGSKLKIFTTLFAFQFIYVAKKK